MTAFSLDFASLSRDYQEGRLTPEAVIEDLLARIAARGDDGVWIALGSRADLLAAAGGTARRRAAGETLPLYGLPFAVKDNIDVAGFATTAACPAFAYTPAADAPVVARLRAAGAIVIGKTNLDQFATGLVGVRSPYGVPRNPFDARYIPGGSSSGSAVAVAAGLVSFALGTDTAGSGRIPAAFNNVVGLKPSRGLLSMSGVVPACRSLDCLSIFGLTCEEVAQVADLAVGHDPLDPFSRRDADRARFAPLAPPARFQFAVPAPAALEFYDDQQALHAFDRSLRAVVAAGGEVRSIDFAPFREAAGLLYDGPFVAERLEAAGTLLAERPEALLPVIGSILVGATRFTAQDLSKAQTRLRALRRAVGTALAEVDMLLVPSAPTIYTVAEVEADPLALNARLGAYTNFVNLLDLAAIAVPTGFREDGLPAGVTLIGPRGSEARLGGIASRLHRATSTRLGATPWPLPAIVLHPAPPAEDRSWLPLVVVGAHLTGQPLNHQLIAAGGRLRGATRTAAAYRLYALPGTNPPKPGLMRAPVGEGAAIEVEVWELPPAGFAHFVAAVPAPLCIGSVELEGGARVSGFLCEPHAIAGARDISPFGGWRAFRDAHQDL
jgi:allophanate hydrolase